MIFWMVVSWMIGFFMAVVLFSLGKAAKPDIGARPGDYRVLNYLIVLYHGQRKTQQTKSVRRQAEEIAEHHNDRCEVWELGKTLIFKKGRNIDD